MKKIDLDCVITIENKCEITIILDFKNVFPHEFCHGLSLLKENLIKKLVIFSKQSHTSLTFIYDKNIDKFTKYSYKNNRYIININLIQIEFWQIYLLKYYRDNFAEVRHIHTEIDSMDGNDKKLDFIIKVDMFKEPMAGKEANKLLFSE